MLSKNRENFPAVETESAHSRCGACVSSCGKTIYERNRLESSNPAPARSSGRDRVHLKASSPRSSVLHCHEHRSDFVGGVDLAKMRAGFGHVLERPDRDHVEDPPVPGGEDAYADPVALLREMPAQA